LVFDISSEYDDAIQANWYNTKTLKIEAITKLPEIEEEQNNYQSSSNGRGFNRRGGGGGRGGNYSKRDNGYGSRNNGSSNGQRSGGFKRSFDSAQSYTPSKKIKFDD
jgi:hypothetical protein